VLETLQGVQEQVERRTYGAHSAGRAVGAWEALARQLRVLLVLRSRVPAACEGFTSLLPKPSSATTSTTATSFSASTYLAGGGGGGGGCGGGSGGSGRLLSYSVAAVDAGRISLLRLLAADTLGFAVRVEQAIDHEDRCREAAAAGGRAGGRAGGAGAGGGAGGAGAGAGGGDALLAWGAAADRRWRDLVAVAVSEDELAAEVRREKQAKDRDRGTGTGRDREEDAVPGAVVESSSKAPVLSSAPASAPPAASQVAKRSQPPQTQPHSHNQSQSQNQQPRRRRPLLLYFPRHNDPHSLGAYRAVVLSERFVHAVCMVCLHAYILVCICLYKPRFGSIFVIFD
jgi:hypothetical protein